MILELGLFKKIWKDLGKKEKSRILKGKKNEDV